MASPDFERANSTGQVVVRPPPWRGGGSTRDRSCSHPVLDPAGVLDLDPMRGVGYRMGRMLRDQWRTTVALSLIVAVVTGALLTLAAGAERTSSAPDRYTSASGGGFDGEVQQESGPPRTSEVAALPELSSVDAITFVFGGLAEPGGAPVPDAFVFAGSHRALGSRLVAGREPDPEREGEFVATRSFADAKDVAVGARFDLLTLTQDQADRAGFDAFAAEGPGGPSLEAVLVGLVDSPSELNDPTPLAVFPPSLLDDGDVGVASTTMSVQLRPGSDLATFRAELDSLPDGETLSLEPAELISSEVRTAVQVQARALWLLAAVGAASGIVVLGQLLSRTVRLTGEEESRLEAIGFTRSQRLAESFGCGVVPIVAGTALGAAVSTSLSSFFPTGFVGRIEPHPGLRVDATLLAACTAGLVVALLLWIVGALVVAKPARVAGRPSALVESVATRCRSAALSTGIRFALTRSRRDRGSVRAAVTGMAVAVAVLVGGVVFGSSLGRLLTDGERFGYNFDLASGTGGDAVPDELRASLEADADIDALMLYGVGQARVGSTTLGLAGMEPVKGDLAPTILEGRLPSAEDEIALGRIAARDLDTEVGADLEIEGADQTRRFRVTGLAVVPAVEGLDGVGQDAVVTMGGLARLDPAAKPSMAAVSLRSGAPAGTADRLGLGEYDRPITIVNLARIRSIPFLFASLVGAAAVLSIVHGMVTSVHNRRREVAVLRALGADRRWITRTVHWQVTVFSLVPLALGLPLGLIAGRLVFVEFADGIGTVPDPSLPFALLSAVMLGFVALANASAAWPARRARRLAPVPLLAGE